jgi:hypothetical protein
MTPTILATPKRRGAAVASAALAALIAPAASAQPAPANTLRALFAELQQCLAAPGGPPGSELTIVFSLRRDGALLGKPRISFARLPGDAADERRFAAGVAAAFDRCLPVAITDALGGAIAGRPLSLRFVVRARQTGA